MVLFKRRKKTAKAKKPKRTKPVLRRKTPKGTTHKTPAPRKGKTAGRRAHHLHPRTATA